MKTILYLSNCKNKIISRYTNIYGIVHEFRSLNSPIRKVSQFPYKLC